MANGVGARFLLDTNLVSSDGSDTWGNPGGWYTHEEIAASEAENKTARVYPGGKDNLMLKCLQAESFDRGSANAAQGPIVWFWGVMGFGELNSTHWAKNKLLTVRLGGQQLVRGNRDTVAALTQINRPDGTLLTGVRSDQENTQDFSDPDTAGMFQAATLAAMTLQDIDSQPRLAQTGSGGGSASSDANTGEGGFVQLAGVGRWQMILITHNKFNWTKSSPNFVVNLI